MTVPDKHQLKICKDTVCNPIKGLLLGSPTAQESEYVLRTKFRFTDRQISTLKGAK